MQDVLSFTGHRPGKLGGYDQQIFDRLVALAEAYLREVDPVWGISGVALGWDQAAAQACTNLGIRWTAAVPFIGQESRWTDYQKARYARLLAQANDVHVVSAGAYAAGKMVVRDHWMVDNSNRLCALYDGSSSGTQKTVIYAKGRIPIDNLWSRWAP